METRSKSMSTLPSRIRSYFCVSPKIPLEIETHMEFHGSEICVFVWYHGFVAGNSLHQLTQACYISFIRLVWRGFARFPYPQPRSEVTS